jgi:hypothetical protein
MDRRSTEGVLGEWRKQALSGQVLCRTSIGAACRAGAYGSALSGCEISQARISPKIGQRPYRKMVSEGARSLLGHASKALSLKLRPLPPSPLKGLGFSTGKTPNDVPRRCRYCSVRTLSHEGGFHPLPRPLPSRERESVREIHGAGLPKRRMGCRVTSVNQFAPHRAFGFGLAAR